MQIPAAEIAIVTARSAKIQVFGDQDRWYYRTWIDNVYKGESRWLSGPVIYTITL